MGCGRVIGVRSLACSDRHDAWRYCKMSAGHARILLAAAHDEWSVGDLPAVDRKDPCSPPARMKHDA